MEPEMGRMLVNREVYEKREFNIEPIITCNSCLLIFVMGQRFSDMFPLSGRI